jgi:dihydroorotase-like cyclic amidohydrolase
LIDVHVHLRESGGNHKEHITSDTSVALAGGYYGIYLGATAGIKIYLFFSN